MHCDRLRVGGGGLEERIKEGGGRRDLKNVSSQTNDCLT